MPHPELTSRPKRAVEIGYLRHRKTRLTLTRRFAPPSPTRRGRTISGGVLKQTFHGTPLPLYQETSVCSLEVSALMCGSLPRPRRKGGRSDGGRGGRVRVNPREVVLKMSKLFAGGLHCKGTTGR